MSTTHVTRHGSSGFTLIEILAVMAIAAILAGMVLPSTTTMMRGYRIKGDAQAVNNLVALAKMRAAAQYSRARVYVDLSANTFALQRWNKTTSRWVTEGDPVPTSTGVTFGFGSLASPPPNTQAAIGQSPVCTDDAGMDIDDTACVTFNSRGMPVDNTLPPGGGVVGNSALYLTDGSTVYATTITTTPLIKSWWSPMTDNNWVRQ